jgi:hypothetical protein
VTTPAPDEELAARQSALQMEAAALLDELDQAGVFTGIGPPEVTGSYISNLMCWRDLDVGLLVGPDYGPRDVLHLISRVMELPGVVGFDYRDERADRSPTGLMKEERYHVPFHLARGAGIWRLDLTLWLHDLHENITAWHEALRDSITGEQRAAVLRIKDVWFRLPSYPIKSVAPRSIPPSSMTEYAHRISSAIGSPTGGCPTPEQQDQRIRSAARASGRWLCP